MNVSSAVFDPELGCTAFTVERMKTLWAYMQAMFPESKREIKAIMKSRSMDGYSGAVGILVSSGALHPEGVKDRLGSGS